MSEQINRAIKMLEKKRSEKILADVRRNFSSYGEPYQRILNSSTVDDDGVIHLGEVMETTQHPENDVVQEQKHLTRAYEQSWPGGQITIWTDETGAEVVILSKAQLTALTEAAINLQKMIQK